MNVSLPTTIVERLRSAWAARRFGDTALTTNRLCELGSALAEEKKAILSFTAKIEEEFLALGALLRKIMAVARQIREQSDQVMSAASGRSEDAAIQFAFQLLKKAEDLVRASQEQQEYVFGVFEKMHVDLKQVASERSELVRTLSPLDTANTQFRIQACAFDEATRAQFFALADDIRGIVRDVQTAVEQRFEELDQAGDANHELVIRLAALASEQKSETDRRLSETRDELSKLGGALRSSEETAQAMGQAGEKIAGGVSKAIVALQSQDMARQKFQHICAAMDEMDAHLKAGSAKRLSGAEDADCRHFLGDAGRVQLGQLRSVFEQLENAAHQVAAGLMEIEAEAKSFADHAVLSGATTLDSQVIGRAIESINALLRVIDSAVASIQSVANLVAKLKSTFSDCTSQVLGLALRLRMIALNAQIFAAHVDAGAALEVVASNTRTIADESMRQLDGISSRVTKLVDSVVDLEQRLSDYTELAGIEQRLLASEAGESEGKLQILERELRNALTAIWPLQRELSETIHQATTSIRFPEAVKETSIRTTGFFEQIALQYSDGGSHAQAIAHEKVRNLERNYTMAHERAVHEAAVGPPSARDIHPQERNFELPLETNGPLPGHDVLERERTQPDPIQSSENDEEKLADNVELF
jgi:hypothetical protein